VSDRFYERCTCPDEARCAIREVMKEAREAVVGIMETGHPGRFVRTLAPPGR